MLAMALSLFTCFLLYDQFWGRRSGAPSSLQVSDLKNDIRPSASNAIISGGVKSVVLGGQGKPVSLLGAVKYALKKSLTAKVFLAFTLLVIVVAIAFAVYWTAETQTKVLTQDLEGPEPDLIDQPDQDDPMSLPSTVWLVLAGILAVFVTRKVYGCVGKKGVLEVPEGKGLSTAEKGAKKNVEAILSEEEKLKSRVKEFFTQYIPLLSPLPSSPDFPDYHPEFYKFDTKPPTASVHWEPINQNPFTKDYKMGECLGRGGYGSVWAAEWVDDGIGTTVAIKEIWLWKVPDDQRSMMRREAALMKYFWDMDHEHFVQVFEYYEHDNILYIVMEQLQGTALQNFTKISLRDISIVARELLLAIQTMHEAGWRHRDIKPDNVFITKDGGVKLIDLGVAGPIGDDGYGIGTDSYMAPELNDLTLEDRAAVFKEIPHDFTDKERQEILRKCAQHEVLDIYSLGKLLASTFQDDDKFWSFCQQLQTEEPWRRPTVSNLLTHPCIKAYEREKSLSETDPYA